MNPLIILLVLTQGIVAAAERPQDFAYGIAIRADSNDALHEIEIPAAVYRGVARNDLGDIRVFNREGEAVPHALRPRAVMTEQTGAAVGLPVFPLYGESSGKLEDLSVHIEKRADGTIIDIQSRAKGAGPTRQLRGYILDASAVKFAIHALQCDWKGGSDSFVGKIRVEGSDDLAGWINLADNAALARLTFEGHQVQRNHVELGAAKFKYLRLSWPEKQSPLESLGVGAVPAAKNIASPRVWQGVAGVAVASRAGEYSYDLGGYFPFDRLRVELPQVNSLAQMQILARAKPSDEWRPAMSAVAYRLRAGDTEVTSPEIIVASSGERYWLLRVDQKGGGIGAGVPALQIGWVPHKLVFAARGAGPFQLAYGSSGVKPAAFAIESLIPGYKTDAEFNVKPAALGERITLAGAGRLRAQWDYKKLALWSSLILGVLVLAWMAFRLARQISKPSSDAQDGGKAT